MSDEFSAKFRKQLLNELCACTLYDQLSGISVGENADAADRACGAEEGEGLDRLVDGSSWRPECNPFRMLPVYPPHPQIPNFRLVPFENEAVPNGKRMNWVSTFFVRNQRPAFSSDAAQAGCQGPECVDVHRQVHADSADTPADLPVPRED